MHSTPQLSSLGCGVFSSLERVIESPMNDPTPTSSAATSGDQLAILDMAGPVATLWLNRPQQRNALSLALITSLHDRVKELHQLPENQSPRVLIMRGKGKVFCAGMDLKAVLDDPEAPEQLLGALAKLTLSLRRLPLVVIACAHGAAIGGGCGLTSVADIALTHDQAKVGYPEVDLGVCPAVVAPWLVQKVGAGMARKILLTGGLLSGQEAAAVGLMNASYADSQALNEATDALAKRIARGGQAALAATKGLLNELEGSAANQHDMARLVQQGAALSAEIVCGQEAQQSLRQRFGKA